MFKDLYNFNIKRSYLESILYYFKCCLVIAIGLLIICLVFGTVWALVSFMKNGESIQEIIIDLGGSLAHYLSSTFCIIITSLIIYEKKLYNIWSMILSVLVFISAFYWGGALLGFVFTSILTTFDNKNVAENL